MEKILIERWWPHLDLRSKQWLRENLRSEEIPSKVELHIAEAGGPASDPLLSQRDWDFIETQSEFVD